jgi:hypothetical protein
VDRVELQQVRRCLRRATDLVDVSDGDLRPVPGGAQREAADTPEAVDAEMMR